MVSEMLNFMVFEEIFEQLQSMEIKFFILLNTVVGNYFEIQVSNMIQESTSFL